MLKAIFAAGCFWGVEKTFSEVKGVEKTEVGYAQGHTVNPTYEDVCGGETNHAEVVLIEFNETTVSYEPLVRMFYDLHDPTTLNQQGPDRGTQYRSIIIYYDENQKNIANVIYWPTNNNFKEALKLFPFTLEFESFPCIKFFNEELNLEIKDKIMNFKNWNMNMGDCDVF